MAKFAVRARAVDMLGRQQIAGISTAIHELFKNAYDAYATRIEVDYLRDGKVVVIRDNGIGMTRQDFEGRWLALGTESKHSHTRQREEVWTGPNNLPIRPVLGEKGIGRLAIATIAPIALVLTRAVRRDGTRHPITCGLVCWDLFEVPGLDISAIEIPVEDFADLPDGAAIARLRDAALANAEAIIPPDWTERDAVLNRLRDFAVDPVTFDDWFSGDPDASAPNLTLRDGAPGTHFYLSPPSPDLEAELKEKDEYTPSNIRRILLGFGNSFAPDSTPPIATAFRDHHHTGAVNNILSPEEFFIQQDFLDCDHLVEGSFDETGTFTGTIQIYGQAPRPYIVAWPEPGRSPLRCGPFTVRLAALQGDKRESLSPRHDELFVKTNRYGGFYLYMDGIRVLPYGQPEVDWLEIEKRRTLKAATWFFSHRRMIGYVALERPASAGLVEKAGREGFRQNQAYRDLRDVLENWLKQIAQDFFRENAEQGEAFREIRDGLKRDADLLKKREKQVRERRKGFVKTLDDFLTRLENREADTALRALLQNFQDQLSSLSGKTPDLIRRESLTLEQRTRAELATLLEIHRLPRPRGFALTKRQQEAFDAYQDWFAGFEAGDCKSASDQVKTGITTLRQEAQVEIERQIRAAAALTASRSDAEKVVRSLQKQTEQTLEELTGEVRRLLREQKEGFRNELETVLSRLSKSNLDALPAPEAEKAQTDLEAAITAAMTEQKRFLEDLSEQFSALRQDLTQRTTTTETVILLEKKIATLEDELAAWRDLAQSGSAVSILGHEVTNMIGGIRRAISTLKPWADATPDLRPLYHELRDNFDHIDGLLGLFTPLARRMRRQKRLITGTELQSYLNEAFQDRAKENRITLSYSADFLRFTTETYMSTLLAALVNILDNALYWLSSDTRNQDRRIWLTATAEGLLIGNNGPGIDRVAARHVFDFTYSTKPDGRGMGLTISRDALRSAGMDLRLLTAGHDANPEFLIVTATTDQPEGDEDGNGDSNDRNA